jgi:hypothetical protein
VDTAVTPQGETDPEMLPAAAMAPLSKTGYLTFEESHLIERIRSETLTIQ